MSNRNAKVIVPFAIVAWLASFVVFAAGTPPVVEAAFVITLAIAIPVMAFYLMAEEGWSLLARRYRARAAFVGPWRLCPTGTMALVSVDDPAFQRRKVRLVGGMLRIGTSPEALHLSMAFSRIPLLGLFFPDVRIPWSAVTTARTYEAPGWFKPASEPGTILQVGYDPNYTGTFVELAIGDPPVFIQLPAEILGEAMSLLPLLPPTPAG